MDLERVQAEVEAKVAAEEQNQDVLLRKIRAQVTHAYRQISSAAKKSWYGVLSPCKKVP